MVKKRIPASEQLPMIANGSIDQEICEALYLATEKCLEVGSPAVVTVKFTIKQHNHKDGTVKIQCDVASKLPKEKTDGAIVFVTPDGNLANSDPKQQTLNLKPVLQEEGKDKLQSVEPSNTPLRMALN